MIDITDKYLITDYGFSNTSILLLLAYWPIMEKKSRNKINNNEKWIYVYKNLKYLQ